ncbi:hypothetical protein [Lentzea kentuckyensis]|uniref:hypothetical protein n=1 Tax=Lentzea kentuckyensis TaxID=360086 RepID=UPI00117ABB10|nr:hypothetical protein [Lentzea kentuckyensis]
MYPTVTVEHLSSVPFTDDSDDMKIYEFDREATLDVFIGGSSWTNTMPGSRFVKYEEVLAA